MTTTIPLPELSDVDKKNLLDASDHLLDRDVVAQAQRLVTAAVTADREGIATRLEQLTAHEVHDELCSVNDSWRNGGSALNECDCWVHDLKIVVAELRGRTPHRPTDTTTQETP